MAYKHEVRAKKRLGQHFLTDQNIAQRIVDSLTSSHQTIVEIGRNGRINSIFIEIT